MYGRRRDGWSVILYTERLYGNKSLISSDYLVARAHVFEKCLRYRKPQRRRFRPRVVLSVIMQCHFPSRTQARDYEFKEVRRTQERLSTFKYTYIRLQCSNGLCLLIKNSTTRIIKTNCSYSRVVKSNEKQKIPKNLHAYDWQRLGTNGLTRLHC